MGFFKKIVVFNESPPAVNAWKGEVFIAWLFPFRLASCGHDPS